MATSNIVSAILGHASGRIKWDATWNLLAWLFDAQQGHGLTARVLNELTHQVFAQRLQGCKIRTEVNLGPGEDGKTKWPDLVLFFPSDVQPTHVIVMDDVDVRSPNSSRKLANLLAYGKIAKLKFPDADVKVVAITNAVESLDIAKVGAALQKGLGDSDSLIPGTIGWHLIALQSIGVWTRDAIAATPVDAKVKAFLHDFIEWSGAPKVVHEPPSIERTA